MTAIADLVSHLLSTGIPPEAVARAVELAQLHVKESAEIHRNSGGTPVDLAAEKRRAYDRERKRTSAETPKRALTTLLPSSSTDSQKKKEGVVGRARGSRLAPDWQPAQEDLNFAVCHLPESRISEEIEKFRDYWHARAGPGGVKLDWAATWRGWIRRAKQDGTNRPNGTGDRGKGFSAYALELAREAAGHEPPADS